MKGERKINLLANRLIVACIDTIDHPSIELVATPSLSLEHDQVCVGTILIQSTVRNTSGIHLGNKRESRLIFH